MTNLIIIIVTTVIFGGCTINFVPSKSEPEKEIKTEVTETIKETHKPWPHEEKEFWYAKYFLSMAMNPNVQKMLTPRQVFDVVRCTVDGFEKDYKYEKFVEEIGENTVLPPHTSQYVYDLSFECAQEIKRKLKREFQEQDEKPLTLKESI